MTKLELILDSVERVCAKDFEVRPGRWGVFWDRERKRFRPNRRNMCALGAALCCYQPQPKGDDSELISGVRELLGVDTAWFVDFQLAFDGVHVSDSDAGRMGALVRDKVNAPQ